MKIPNAISIRVSKIIQKNQFVKDILQSIENRSGRVLLVGGAVRDLFLDLPIKDLDFEVYGLTLDQLQAVLQVYGVVSLIGKSFGVLRLHGLDVDWSLPRKDSQGRHPVVAYDPNMSYEQAFARRDVTINAMGIVMNTMELIDPFDGLHDLECKILRSPDLDFFEQDPLRLLRVMQFVGRFTMVVDEQLSQLCSTIDMTKVSQERIEQEFRKLFLQAQKPSLGLQWLMKIGKFNEFLPEIKDDQKLLTTIDIAACKKYASDEEKIVVMWAVILAQVNLPKIKDSFEHVTRSEKQPYIDFIRRIHHHDLIIRQVVACVVYSPKLVHEITDAQLKWLAVWLAPELSIRTFLCFMEIIIGESCVKIFFDHAHKIGVLDFPEQPLLTGKDFLEFAQGVQLGVLVKKSYEIQIDKNIIDKNELKKMVLENQD
ncbi:CCA tRNA nucleotidyltransferase [Candidatus Babeliales bacterium]|nr:CCA tRNA nucleotidyltransferase [Candidatus Babeliales bacterium]MBP9844321.1 CCA tRNA nucleotidyltransferase [Candidatus Babeliales bacterium]